MTSITKKLRNFLSLTTMGLVFVTSISVSAFAGSFDFNPPGRQFISGCRNSITIDVDPGAGRQSNAADIEISYNPSQVNILDSDPNIPGTQIRPGNAYETYFGNQVDTGTGKILLAGASFVGSLSSRKTFATVEFTNTVSTTAAAFTIKFDGTGATLDSNVAEASTSDDLLSSVTNGSYTFIAGNCTADTIPPVVNYQQPTNYASGISLTSQVKINITDNASGVDLATVKFNINGDLYTANDPAVTYTGTPLNYVFTITPRNPFYADQASQIMTEAKDLAGNLGRGQIIFNIPPAIIEEKLCPVIEGNNSSSSSNSPNTPLPRTGGSDEEAYTKQIETEAITNSLVTNPGWNDPLVKPIVDGFYGAKNLDASLKTLQTIIFGNILIAILGLYLFWWANKKFYIEDVAFEEKTKQPYAKMVLYLQNLLSNKILDETQTDKDGNYSFYVKSGAYQVISKTDPSNFSNIVVVAPNGEIRRQREIYTSNGKSQPIVLKYSDTFTEFLSSYAPGLTLAGFIFSLCAFWVVSSFINTLILFFYIAFIFFYWILPWIIEGMEARKARKV